MFITLDESESNASFSLIYRYDMYLIYLLDLKFAFQYIIAHFYVSLLSTVIRNCKDDIKHVKLD